MTCGRGSCTRRLAFLGQCTSRCGRCVLWHSVLQAAMHELMGACACPRDTGGVLRGGWCRSSFCDVRLFCLCQKLSCGTCWDGDDLANTGERGRMRRSSGAACAAAVARQACVFCVCLVRTTCVLCLPRPVLLGLRCVSFCTALVYRATWLLGVVLEHGSKPVHDDIWQPKPG